MTLMYNQGAIDRINADHATEMASLRAEIEAWKERCRPVGDVERERDAAEARYAAAEARFADFTKAICTALDCRPDEDPIDRAKRLSEARPIDGLALLREVRKALASEEGRVALHEIVSLVKVRARR